MKSPSRVNSDDRPDPGSAIDPQWFRQVLGQYPTGVCAVTAQHPDEGLVGMIVGTFTSVSLDPPLIAFFPDKQSTSWPKIRDAGRFCVNILASDQEAVCRQIASKGAEKFRGIAHEVTPSGAAVLSGVVGWIDCDIASVDDAGDHHIVLGAVRDLTVERPSLPLLFFRGGYGRFHPLSLVAPDTNGALTAHLRNVDLIKPVMEDLARRVDCSCIAVARTGEDVTIVASAGSLPADQRGGTLVGARLPFLPPTGAVFAAWNGQEADDWLRRSVGPDSQARFRAALSIVRERGYSVAMMSQGQRALATAMDEVARRPEAVCEIDLRAVVNDLVYDPDELTGRDSSSIRQVSAPVFGPDGKVSLALTIFDFGRRPAPLLADIDKLLETSRRATELINGRHPG